MEGKIYDMNGNELEGGHVIRLDQTVNGFHLFAVMSLDPLEIKYCHWDKEKKIITLHRDYEYDKKTLLDINPLSGETDFIIITTLKDNTVTFYEEGQMAVESPVASPEIPNMLSEVTVLNPERAMQFILERLYFEEWESIGGLNQHKDGLSFNEWLDKNNLLDRL